MHMQTRNDKVQATTRRIQAVSIGHQYSAKYNKGLLQERTARTRASGGLPHGNSRILRNCSAAVTQCRGIAERRLGRRQIGQRQSGRRHLGGGGLGDDGLGGGALGDSSLYGIILDNGGWCDLEQSLTHPPSILCSNSEKQMWLRVAFRDRS